MGTDPATIAIKLVALARAGQFGEMQKMFAPVLRAVVSGETVRAGWTAELARAGQVAAVGEPACEPGQPGLIRVQVPVRCERGGFTVLMSVDAAGKLHGLRLAPLATASWAPPRYATPERFVERDVTFGDGAFAVPGTLTLPHGPRPRPGVVLLAGSGPFDRDQSIGPNKPLKDLAWGLASRDVAVARFDKVTHVHPSVATQPGFTMVDEYMPHAIAAVRRLQSESGVDPARVFVIGHSGGGGRAAPRVAAVESSIAGVVMLAGDAAPLGLAAIRTARYLAALQPGPDAQNMVAMISRQAALVDSSDLSPATPASDLLFGWPASYWLDLRGFDQVATAAALDRPLLILQGVRDYQVTVEDDLARWRAGLAHRSDVTFRVHYADDHMFFAGSGPSTPADYDLPRHVDPAVIDDIARWLERLPLAD